MQQIKDRETNLNLNTFLNIWIFIFQIMELLSIHGMVDAIKVYVKDRLIRWLERVQEFKAKPILPSPTCCCMLTLSWLNESYSACPSITKNCNLHTSNCLINIYMQYFQKGINVEYFSTIINVKSTAKSI